MGTTLTSSRASVARGNAVLGTVVTVGVLRVTTAVVTGASLVFIAGQPRQGG